MALLPPTLLHRCRLRAVIQKSRLLHFCFQCSHSQPRPPLESDHLVAAAPVALAPNFSEIHARNFSQIHARDFSSTRLALQQPQIQTDDVTSDPQPFILPQPSPTASGKQDTLVGHPPTPAEIASLDVQALGREMNICLARENPVDSVKIFEEWKNAVNTKTGGRNLPNRVLFNLYIHSRLKLGSSYRDLCDVLKEMEKANFPPDLTVYNLLLRAVSRERDATEAEALLNKMEQSGKEAQPDEDSYNLVMVICALSRRIDSALKYFKTMRHKGFEPSKMSISESVLAASRLHRTRVAVELLKDIKDTDKIPPTVVCAELLVAATDVDDAECASLTLDFLRQKPTGKFSPILMFDEGTMLSVLCTAVRKADGILADKVWDTLVGSLGDQQYPSPALYHAWIHAYSAAGNLTAAFRAVEELQNAHCSLKEDTNTEIFSPFSSLRPLVLACLKSGTESLDGAYYLLEEIHSKQHMQALGPINCLILACSNAWDVDRAYQTFQSIGSVFGLIPDVHSYNSLLAGLAKTKQVSEALKVYEHIQTAGMTPDFRTYEILLDAHLANHDTKSAVDLLSTMMAAGQAPLQQSTQKVWKRCFQEGDSMGITKVKNVHKRLGYALRFRGEDRVQTLFDLLKVKA